MRENRNHYPFKLFPLLLLFISSATLQGQTPAIQQGKASYYADYFEGRNCASGEKYHKDLITAAHKTLPFGTIVRVTNLSNHKTLDVRINDRGPFVAGRIIDLSRKAAEEIGLVMAGVAPVTVEVLALPGQPLPDAPDAIMTETMASAKVIEAPATTVEPVHTIVEIKAPLKDRLKAANLPDAELPVTGFTLEVGRYHYLGNVRAMYLNLGKLANEPFFVAEGPRDAEGDQYIAMVGLVKNREDLDVMLHEAETTFPEAKVVDLAKLSGNSAENGDSKIAP